MYKNFNKALGDLDYLMEYESNLVHTDNWQGTDISQNSQAQMCELLHESLKVELSHSDLSKYANDIKPNLPWADDHFLERVCGEPLNPGKTWEHWPWHVSADDHRDRFGQFNHNYMERYWPKLAGRTVDGTLDGNTKQGQTPFIHHGIRHEYGDLEDLVQLLREDPSTRQAYLPIWFPEDTGVVHNGRKPCTLGYHFIIRNGKMDVTYYIRSCDYHRHLRDDIYLTVRLLLWLISECGFTNVKPGRFIMHITSLHMFVGDYQLRYKAKHHETK